MTHQHISGIYAITNTVNGHQYIGSSCRIMKRWGHHRGLLRQNRHHSPYLQSAWWRYGEEAFEFTIIEECERSLLFEREQFYIDTLSPDYNVGQCAENGMRGRHISPEAKAKISAYHKSRKHSQDEIARGVQTRKERCKRIRDEREQWKCEHPGEKLPLIRSPLSDEHKAKIAAKIAVAARGRKLPESARAKLVAFNDERRANRAQWMAEHPGEKPPLIHHREPLSEETKAKMRDWYARKKEERKQWMEEHPGEKPPPIHVRPKATEAAKAHQTAGLKAWWARRKAGKGEIVQLPLFPNTELPA